MAYSKLRGARKIKPKKQETQEDTTSTQEPSEDAFQIGGKKLLDEIVEHPYFIIGSIVGVIVIVSVILFASRSMQEAKGDSSILFSNAMKTWYETTGENGTFKDEREKFLKAKEDFEKAESDLKGSTMGDVSSFFIAKAHYRLKEYGKAADIFRSVQKSSNIAGEMKFGAYEGEAFCFFDRNDYEKAISVWNRYLKEVSGDVYKDYALYYIGLSYEKEGKKERAVEYFQKLTKEYPKSLLTFQVKQKLPQKKS